MSLVIGDLVGLIRADDSGMRRGLNDAELRMRGFQRDVNGQLRTLNGRFATTGELLAAGIREGTQEGRRFGFELGRIASAGRGLLGAVSSLGRMAVLLGAAVPVAAGLVAALSQIAPAAAVGVSALVALQLASNTLKIAMVGVGDAVKAALDPEGAEAYAEAIKKLSPEARKFTDSLRAMAPELDKLRKAVQDRVFAGLNKEMERTAKSVAPALKRALLSTGDTLNRMAKGAGAAARDLGDKGVLGRALDSATKSLENMEKVPGRVVTSLGLLASASGPSLERIAKKADEVSARITDSLTDSFESGRLERAIDGAIDALAQMGRIVRNIFGGLKNIIGGVTDETGSLFSILERVSEAFERLTASEEFQSILRELSKTAGDLVDNVLPLLKEAFIQLAPVIRELGPPIRDFINKIGPELLPLMRELGPILVDLAVILREQMPFAIKLATAAIQTLTFVLGIVRWVLHNLVVPALRLVSQILNSKYVEAIAAASRETSAKIGVMARRFEEFRSSVSGVVRVAALKIAGFVGSVAGFGRRVAGTVGNMIGMFQRIPGELRRAFGGLGSMLWNSGRALIGGFIGGILSRISEVASAASRVVAAARSYFPFSPAKKGPFSGTGWTLYSGRAISEALAAGIRSREGVVSSAVSGLMAGAHSGIPDVGSGVPGWAQAAQFRGVPQAGGGVTTVRIEVSGPDEVKRLIRKIVKVDGRGSVQTAFGN
ncbi:hypothetical protein [Streptomyces xantholiticus]|uniref:hypothetical protein n=1 Tax=Streptomyces xantholiticus TaxID=68285 RepID=UPI0016753C54|nr:hypothetical protein [Streptomyces xantholiticus]GGW41380.1 hypothetical protein GCM10010381_27810 [Streptomyces xantholiticus]